MIFSTKDFDPDSWLACQTQEQVESEVTWTSRMHALKKLIKSELLALTGTSWSDCLWCMSSYQLAVAIFCV